MAFLNMIVVGNLSATNMYGFQIYNTEIPLPSKITSVTTLGGTYNFINTGDMLKNINEISNIYQINVQGTIYNMQGCQYLRNNTELTKESAAVKISNFVFSKEFSNNGSHRNGVTCIVNNYTIKLNFIYQNLFMEPGIYVRRIYANLYGSGRRINVSFYDQTWNSTYNTWYDAQTSVTVSGSAFDRRTVTIGGKSYTIECNVVGSANRTMTGPSSSTSNMWAEVSWSIFSDFNNQIEPYRYCSYLPPAVNRSSVRVGYMDLSNSYTMYGYTTSVSNRYGDSGLLFNGIYS